MAGDCKRKRIGAPEEKGDVTTFLVQGLSPYLLLTGRLFTTLDTPVICQHETLVSENESNDAFVAPKFFAGINATGVDNVISSFEEY